MRWSDSPHYLSFFILLFLFVATHAQTDPVNKCPTQCDLASMIPTDGSAITLGPAFSTYIVNAANLININDDQNKIQVFPSQPSWKAGTVLVLYQATGATVNVIDPASRDFGSVTSLGNAGNWEIVKISRVIDNNNFALQCALSNPYNASLTTVIEAIVADQITILDGVQVVPAGHEANFSISNGVVAVVANVINMGVGSKISASARGFLGGVRGGVNTSILCMDCAETCKQLLYDYTDPTWGALRGGSVAGHQHDTWGRGAIANGGGGGNNHNAAGGGGANGWASIDGIWTGDGVMNTLWTAGWLLETPTLSTSIGGGRGGYSFSALEQDPLVVPPGDCAWQGNSRLNNGGLGGRPLKFFQAADTYTKLFYGGGGGAGHENDWVGGSGGNGGGFAIVIANQILGAAGSAIEANGAVGDSSLPIPLGPFDGCGGGGAGGSIFLAAYQALSATITISAQGGKGGDNIALTTGEAEGGAGGGGGGVISLIVPPTANPCSAASVAGGSSGVQQGKAAFATFKPNGGTDGNAGQCIVVTTSPPCLGLTSPSLSISPSMNSSGSTAPSTSSKGGSSTGSSSDGGSSKGGGSGSGVNNGGKGGKGKNSKNPNPRSSPNHNKNNKNSNNNKNNQNDDDSDSTASSLIHINSFAASLLTVALFALVYMC